VKTLLTAAWVAPMDGPILRDAGVVHEAGRIVAVGASASLKAAHPNAIVEDLGDAVVLPGLVNAHVHLELSNCAAGEPPTSFVDWILSMPRRVGRQLNERADALFAAATEAGIAQCQRVGVTCVGDISQQMHVTRPILRAAPLRAVSYGEVIGLAKRRPRFDELLPMALDEEHAGDRLRIGLTPHAPYTVEPADIRRCLQLARERRLPLAIHLAETAEEREFVRAHAGPLRELWERLGHWQDSAPPSHDTPVEFAQALGLLDYPTLLAHVNYCEDDDLALIARGRASVVYCPRTHRYFGHPPHRWREMLAAGINVAVGTDSCASSPDLNLVDDLRVLHEIAPDIAVETIWEMATRRGAQAMQLEDVGTLARGKAADFVAFEARGDDPLVEVLEDADRVPVGIWIGGRRPAR
jgi:cytosine/adenosine deaminase-related metal-dependent hydrolase